MSEIEKLYQNAGIEKKEKGYCDCDYMNCPNPDIEPCGKECCYWVDKGIDYPPFTAEKQIELIQFLSIDRIVTIFYEDLQIYISVCPNNPHDDRQICECGASWVEVLARVINSYWLLFSEEERKQIKEILE